MFKNKGKIFKIIFIVVFILILVGALTKCAPKSSAIVNELLADNNYVFNEDLSYTTLGASYQTYEVNAYYHWFTSNNINFTTIRFIYFFPEPSYRSFSLEFYDSITGSVFRVFESIDNPSTNTLISRTWYSPAFKLISILNTSNVSDTSLLLNILTLNNTFTSYSVGYDAGYVDGLNVSSQSAYDSGYSSGYISGVADGISSGYQSAYNDGYIAGSNDGYQSAYNEGFRDGEMSSDTPYTFKALFLALFDVPLQTINGLLNWDFLGLNLKNFFYTVLTIGVCLFILKQIF